MKKYLVLFILLALPLMLPAQKKKATTSKKSVATHTTRKKKAKTSKTASYTNASIRGLQSQRDAIQKKIKQQEWMYTRCSCGHEFSKHHGDGYYSIPQEQKTKYCPDCGQRLDWSDENG